MDITSTCDTLILGGELSADIWTRYDSGPTWTLSSVLPRCDDSEQVTSVAVQSEDLAAMMCSELQINPTRIGVVRVVHRAMGSWSELWTYRVDNASSGSRLYYGLNLAMTNSTVLATMNGYQFDNSLTPDERTYVFAHVRQPGASDSWTFSHHVRMERNAWELYPETHNELQRVRYFAANNLAVTRDGRMLAVSNRHASPGGSCTTTLPARHGYVSLAETGPGADASNPDWQMGPWWSEDYAGTEILTQCRLGIGGQGPRFSHVDLAGDQASAVMVVMSEQALNATTHLFDPQLTIYHRVPVQECGNWIRDVMEECDDGVRNSLTDPAAVCTPACTQPRCGDGQTSSGISEECDEGDGLNSDLANATCTSACLHPACGDGIQHDGEECDLGASNNDNTPDALCTLACGIPRCGDRVRHTGEMCDDGGLSGGCINDCTTIVAGFNCTAATNSVAEACREICGDGLVVGREACDTGSADSTGCDGCLAVLQGWRCPTPGMPCRQIVCGDGFVDEPEEVCDAKTDVFCAMECRASHAGWFAAVAAVVVVGGGAYVTSHHANVNRVEKQLAKKLKQRQRIIAARIGRSSLYVCSLFTAAAKHDDQHLLNWTAIPFEVRNGLDPANAKKARDHVFAYCHQLCRDLPLAPDNITVDVVIFVANEWELLVALAQMSSKESMVQWETRGPVPNKDSQDSSDDRDFMLTHFIIGKLTCGASVAIVPTVKGWEPLQTWLVNAVGAATKCLHVKKFAVSLGIAWGSYKLREHGTLLEGDLLVPKKLFKSTMYKNKDLRVDTPVNAGLTMSASWVPAAESAMSRLVAARASGPRDLLEVMNQDYLKVGRGEDGPAGPLVHCNSMTTLSSVINEKRLNDQTTQPSSSHNPKRKFVDLDTLAPEQLQATMERNEITDGKTPQARVIDGGDMEAYTIATIVQKKKWKFLVMKAISDFADGDKTNHLQPHGCQVAMMVLEEMLRQDLV